MTLACRCAKHPRSVGTLGTCLLPLASSDINETEAGVRARDDPIIAIGGLQSRARVNKESSLPGAQARPQR